MPDRLHELLERMRQLESELLVEFHKKEKEYFYEIRHKKVLFEKRIKCENKRLVKRVHRYLADAALLNLITVPIIWLCLVPALFMDCVVSLFQLICFPIYSIPKVKRGDYIVIDRHYLSYLNWIEKINCCYCAYFNGVIGYVQEIAARTEQYWCPIKHARRTKATHSRYKNFFDYGDGRRYREKIKEVRSDFDDVD